MHCEANQSVILYLGVQLAFLSFMKVGANMKSASSDGGRTVCNVHVLIQLSQRMTNVSALFAQKCGKPKEA